MHPSPSISESEVQLPAVSGRDPAALALLPITLAGRDVPATETISVAYQVQVDGQPRRVVVDLECGKAGWPTHADQMVYLALVQIAVARGEAGEVLVFERSELMDMLGWGKGGSSYQRIKEALSRLWGLGIVLQSAMISRKGEEYRRRTEAVRIIDRYELGEGDHGTICTVEWGHPVREAFRLGDMKRLDWDLLLALGNPLTSQLYRLLDRVVLSGEQLWSIQWRALAQALGMSTSYNRPAKLRDKLQPHIDALIDKGVIDGSDYERGGVFVFHIRNYLRAQLRRVLVETFGVFEKAASQVLAAHDELEIMEQCDCLYYGSRPKPQNKGGYLVEAIRKGYELRYADDDTEHFLAMWGMLSQIERDAYHRAGIKLLGVGYDLFETNAEPTAWTDKMRHVVRFFISHTIDPDEVLVPGSTRIPDNSGGPG